jgi:peptidoglycan/LPS O-acetylase OafA/YrhL
MNNPERRNDIDWLRVLAMLMIFLFHCARFFDGGFWHVKNNQLTFGADVFVRVVGQWIMPLFFVLSAISTCHALSHRTDRQFVGERIRRLGVPFVFGTLVLIPPQVYIERVSHAQFVGSFIEFLPHYFDGWYGFGGNFAWMGLHLWYLEMLFIFSLLALLLFRYLKRETVQHSISRMAAFFQMPGAIFLFALPLVVVEMLVNLQPDGVGRRDFGGWSLPVYLVLFILGYLIAFDSQFKTSIEKHRAIALVLAVITTAVGFFLLTSGCSDRTYLFAILRTFNSWFWLVAILGFGSRYLDFSNGLLRYANEAVLPFYVLHQTVIVIIAYHIANWDMSVLAKYLVLSTASFAVIVGLYDLAIKRVNVLRFLFGLKPKAR